MGEEELLNQDGVPGPDDVVIPGSDDILPNEGDSTGSEDNIPSPNDVVIPGPEDIVGTDEEDYSFFSSISNEFVKGTYQRAASEKLKAIVTGKEKVRYVPDSLYGEEDNYYLKDLRHVRKIKMPDNMPFWDKIGLIPTDGHTVIDIDDQRKEELISEMYQLQDQVSYMPKSDAMRAIEKITSSNQDSSDKLASLGLLAISHPNMVPELIANSAGTAPEALALGVIGGIGGPYGMIAGSFIGTLASEEANAYMSVLEGSGVDISNPEGFREMMQDPEVIEDIKNKARSRKLSMATTDAILTAITMGIGKGITSPIKKAAFTATSQTAGEGATELAGQIGGGQDVDAAEIGLEMIAGSGGSIAETGSLMISPYGKKAIENLKSTTSGNQQRKKANSDVSPSNKDINEKLATNDAEIDAETDQAVNEMAMEIQEFKDASMEDRMRMLEDVEESSYIPDEEQTNRDYGQQREIDSDQQIQPEENTREVLEVGEEDQPGSNLSSEEANLEESPSPKDKPKSNMRPILKQEAYVPEVYDLGNEVFSFGSLYDENESSQTGFDVYDRSQAESNQESLSDNDSDMEINERESASTLRKEAKARVAKSLLEIDKSMKVSDKKRPFSKIGEFLSDIRNRYGVHMKTFVSERAEQNDTVVGFVLKNVISPLEQAEQRANKRINQSRNQNDKRLKRIENIKSKAKNNNIQLEKLGIFSYLNTKDGKTVNEKVKDIITSAKNEDNSVYTLNKKIDRARKKQTRESRYKEILDSLLDKKSGELKEGALSKVEQEIYSELIKDIDQASQDFRPVAKAFFDKSFGNYENYIGLKIKGKLSLSSKKDVSNIDFENPESYYENLGNDDRINSPLNKRTEQRKGPGLAFYDFDILNMHESTINDVVVDTELAPAVYQVRELLKSERFVNMFGAQNTSELAKRVQQYVKVNKGMSAKKRSSIERSMQSIITSYKSSLLAYPEQWLKQMTGVVGVALNYTAKGDPQSFVKGVQMANKATPEQISALFPGLDLRKENVDHIIESSSRFKQNKSRNITKSLGHGDYINSKISLFVDYADRGGTLENLDTDAANKASARQTRTQGTDTLSFAPEAFANQSLALQVLMPFAMMPINQSRQIIRNINPSKLIGKSYSAKERRAMLAITMTNIAAFQALGEGIRRAYDEVGDELFGEDDFRELDFTSNEVLSKMAIRSISDALYGGTPMAVKDAADAYLAQPFLDFINENSIDADHKDAKVSFGQDEGMEVLLGIGGQILTDFVDAGDNLMKAIDYDGGLKPFDKGSASSYALLNMADISSRLAASKLSYLGSFYGVFSRALMETKNRAKDDFKRNESRYKEYNKEKEKESPIEQKRKELRKKEREYRGY